ncbi:MAG: hypothetical protein MI974_31755 [Chitinophagales bacterium]|nr:hypothetical protein [Chitinophagales bacterium]
MAKAEYFHEMVICPTRLYFIGREKMKSANSLTGIISLVFTMMFFIEGNSQDISVLNDKNKYEIKRQLIKSHDVSFNLIYSDEWDCNKILSLSDWKRMHFIGFGFRPLFPEIAIEAYPIEDDQEANLFFYRAFFPYDLEPNELLSNKLQRKNVALSGPKNLGLFALDVNGNIVFSMYNGVRSNISRFFNLDVNNIKSYTPFIKAHLFNTPYKNEVEYHKRKRDTLIFNITQIRPKGWRAQYEYYIPVKNPDDFQIEEILTYKDNSFQDSALLRPNAAPLYEELPFTSQKEKTEYLKWALMSNLYLHLMNKKIDELKVDDIFNSPYRDSLLPDYDQVLPRLKNFRYGCCWIDERSKRELANRLPRGTKYIFENQGNYRAVVGEKRNKYNHVEYYKLYMDTMIWLEKVPDPQFKDIEKIHTRGAPNGLFESFYQGDGYSIDEKGEITFFPPYPPLTNRSAEIESLSACTSGYSYDTIRNHYDIAYNSIARPVNHYLLALGTRTRDVYFLSGKNVFLSEITPLYIKGKYDSWSKQLLINHEATKDEVEEFLNDSTQVFTYIQDRLYRYLVERLDEDNVIYKDEEKMVLRCQGEEYKEPLELEVTFYYDNPEELEIKVSKQ